jgi:hypothetical protein
MYHRKKRVQDPKSVKARRFCREGGGDEETPGMADTPGFDQNEEDMIVHDAGRNISFLKLKRNERRMKLTSKSMLQSWRANVDMQMIIYRVPPHKIGLDEIRAVASYVVSYATKGSQSFLDEKKMLADLIQSQEEIMPGYDKLEVARVVQKCLNAFHGRRVISKPEVCVELAGLDLVLCSETFETVRTSAYNKIHIEVRIFETIFKKLLKIPLNI